MKKFSEDLYKFVKNLCQILLEINSKSKRFQMHYESNYFRSILCLALSFESCNATLIFRQSLWILSQYVSKLFAIVRNGTYKTWKWNKSKSKIINIYNYIKLEELVSGIVRSSTSELLKKILVLNILYQFATI